MTEVGPSAQQSTCEHVAHEGEKPGMFGKGRVRDFLFQQFLLKQPCALCFVVYPFWKDHADRSRVSSYRDQPPSPASSICDYTSILSVPVEGLSDVQRHPDSVNGVPSRAYNLQTYVLEWTPRQFAMKLDEGGEKKINSFAVQLESGMIGEAYHVLICALILRLLPTPITLQIHIKEGDRSKEIQDLFWWYGIETRSNEIEHPSKKNATKVIASAFRSSNNCDGWGARHMIEQPALFSLLRDRLNCPGWDDRSLKTGGLHPKYLQPTYAAKYWLNRYLCLTRQGKLPKNCEVSRLAVVHLRRTAMSLVGRELDEENLIYVARSIATANQRALQAKEYPFTHVILYGDFDYSEASHLKTIVEQALLQPEEPASKSQGASRTNIIRMKLKPILTNSRKRTPVQEPTKHPVKILFISRPWEFASENVTGENGKVVQLWEKFRNPNFDHLPIQVKVLAIWTTLCWRYRPKMCIIGHRSGFIEGAGFIGVPIFYLNNERQDIGLDACSKGRHLWWMINNPLGDRLRELADVTNTFIPIEALKHKASIEKNTKTGKTKSIFRVEDEHKNELQAALFMYMCCDLTSGMLESNISLFTMERGENPAWTARFDMMHDKCVGHEPGDKGCEDAKHLQHEHIPQTGQEWLRRRYRFATEGNNVRLSSWTGLQMGKWKSQDFGLEALRSYMRPNPGHGKR